MQRDREVAPAVEDNLQRIDPEADGWRSEVLHNTAKAGLKAFLHWATVGGELAPGLLDAEFRGDYLRPKALETLHQDTNLRISHAVALPHGELGPAQAADMVMELRGVLREPQEDHSFFKIITVKLTGGRQFRTEFLYHATAGERFPAQVNLGGIATWRVGASDEEATLLALEIHSYEEMIATRPTFEDVTTGVFAGDRLWQLLMRHGTEEFAERTDRIIGQSYIGSQGLAVGDIDNDGLDDVYVAMPGGYPNRLYRHLPDGSAAEVSAASQVDFLDNTRGVLLLDFDNDGDQDLAASIGANILIAWNDGQGVFAERTVLRKAEVANIYSLSAADPDGDGDLDIYACRYVTGGLIGGVPTPYHDANNGASNFYWRNDGNREWTDATEESGLDENNTKFSLASVWADFDQDGDLDLYVANDFGRNTFYLNDGSGHFQEEGVARHADDLGAAMGASVADVDLDGDLDLLVTNMFSSAGRRIASQDDKFMGGMAQEVHKDYVRHARGNSLLLNDGTGHFEDATEDSGIAIGGWAWGARFVDIDNDGLEDVYSPNGFLTNRGKDDL